MFYQTFLLILLMIVPNIVLAQTKQEEPPHSMPGVEQGVINGQVYTVDDGGKKSPVSNQKVGLVVFQNGQRVLMIDKQADEKGYFTFKNIIPGTSFVYSVAAFYNNKFYMIPHLHLEESQHEIKVDFHVGGASPYEVDQNQLNPDSRTSNNSMMSSPSDASSRRALPATYGGELYKNVALILSGIVVLLALYFGFRRKED